MYIQNRNEYVELLDQLGCSFEDKKLKPISQTRLVERVRYEKLIREGLIKPPIKKVYEVNQAEIKTDLQELTLHNRTLMAGNYFPNDFNDYVYHYTDGKSVYNIICGDYIFPREEDIVFTQINPNSNDLHLIKHLNQMTNREIFKSSLRDKFNKINFAFGFKIKDLPKLSKITNCRHDLWEHEGKIDIRNIRFILVQRKFRYEIE